MKTTTSRPTFAVAALLAASIVAGPVFAQDSDRAAPAPSQETETSDQPRNAVGDKFELPRVSGDNQVELITGLCGVQMKDMTKADCACLAESAMDALSDPQRDYLIASVVAPPVADRMLKDGRVGESDQVTIFTFLNTQSDQCRAGAQGGAEAPDAGEDAASPPAADGKANAQ
ncbi:MAG: hypothetical protein KAG89_06070 [Fulvimarina manganoxydans]|uniref:hypothetical protein n=1 Tax=Fulvimarina manganoxydans TaxID=937218 RepID=UPI0023524542|nr:hypothetical protein [Fulvimarina manganoxydans]MCK5931720.1 hypothetical protein [Fulvimarina manganoxydans]